MSNFHERVKKLRAEAGITQYALAKLTNNTQSNISEIENGIRGSNTPIASLIIMADLFSVSIDYLVGRVD